MKLLGTHLLRCPCKLLFFMINLFYFIADDIQYNIHMGSKKHVKVMMKRKRKLQDTTLHCDSNNEKKIVLS